MLVLSRKINETIIIGENIRITLTSIRGQQVRIAIDAPHDVSIVREELLPFGGVDHREVASPQRLFAIAHRRHNQLHREKPTEKAMRLNPIARFFSLVRWIPNRRQSASCAAAIGRFSADGRPAEGPAHERPGPDFLPSPSSDMMSGVSVSGNSIRISRTSSRTAVRIEGPPIIPTDTETASSSTETTTVRRHLLFQDRLTAAPCRGPGDRGNRQGPSAEVTRAPRRADSRGIEAAMRSIEKASSQGRFEPAIEVVQVDRLDQEIIDPGLAGAAAICRAVIAGQRHDPGQAAVLHAQPARRLRSRRCPEGRGPGTPGRVARYAPRRGPSAHRGRPRRRGLASEATGLEPGPGPARLPR